MQVSRLQVPAKRWLQELAGGARSKMASIDASSRKKIVSRWPFCQSAACLLSGGLDFESFVLKCCSDCVRNMRIHSLVCLVEVPAYLRTRAPVLTAPVHIACHASFGAAYRRRGGTGDPRAAGRSRAIPHVRGMGQLGYVRCPVQVPIGSPKHAHSHAEKGQKRLSACQCAWWGIVRAAY